MPLRISLAHQFEQQEDETWAVHFSFDGCRLVSSDGFALYQWRLTGNEGWVYERSFLFRGATFPHFAPSGAMLAFGGEEGLIRLISVDGRELAIFDTGCSHSDWAFSPNEHWLVSSGAWRNILVWDLTTHQSASIAVPFPGCDQSEHGVDLSDEPIGCFQFTPDNQRLVFGVSSSEGYAHICHFDPVHTRIIRQKTLPIDGIIANAVAPNGNILAIIVPNSQLYAYKQDIYIYDLNSLQLLHIFPQATGKRYCLLAFSPDSRYLMSCKSDGWIDIFSLDSFECIAQFAAHPGLSSHASDPIGGLDWSTTGYIATGGASVFEHDMRKTDYSIKLWKVEEVEDSR